MLIGKLSFGVTKFIIEHNFHTALCPRLLVCKVQCIPIRTICNDNIKYLRLFKMLYTQFYDKFLEASALNSD